MEIRPYNHLTDLTSITPLMSDLGYPTTVDALDKRMERIHRTPSYQAFVALKDDEIVGLVGCRDVYYYEDDGFVTQIAMLVTKKDYQGQGIGKALVTFVEEWATQKGSNGLVLTSGMRPERERAHAFYKKLGFEITGYRFVKTFKHQ